MKALKCPVCNGSGTVPGLVPFGVTSTWTPAENPCPACLGKGWLAVSNDNAVHLNLPELTKPLPRYCPQCGHRLADIVNPSLPEQSEGGTKEK